jgi:hypothetical protein
MDDAAKCTVTSFNQNGRLSSEIDAEYLVQASLIASGTIPGRARITFGKS